MSVMDLTLWKLYSSINHLGSSSRYSEPRTDESRHDFENYALNRAIITSDQIGIIICLRETTVIAQQMWNKSTEYAKSFPQSER